MATNIHFKYFLEAVKQAIRKDLSSKAGFPCEFLEAVKQAIRKDLSSKAGFPCEFLEAVKQAIRKDLSREVREIGVKRLIYLTNLDFLVNF